jgi:protein TonB
LAWIVRNELHREIRTIMNFAQQNRHPASRLTAIGTVGLLHLIVGYALVSGLARKVVEIYRKPVDVSIVEEVKTLPPPPKQIIKPAAPPPAYVPPPEISVATVSAPTAIVATTTVVPPEAPPAPVVPVVHTPPPVAVGAACPNHLAVRSRVPYPPLAQRQGIGGEVLIEFSVGAGGEIGNITIIKSSNPLFESTVINAVGQFQCVGQGHPVRVRVPFAFRLES